MTDDELRRLIAECEDGRLTVRYDRLQQIAAIARDALRFRHITQRPTAFYSQAKTCKFVTSGEWVAHIPWMFKSQEKLDIRAAIDADMEESR